MGRYNDVVGFVGIYFHDGHALTTDIHSRAATSSTVGDGSHPPGSTELDHEAGRNCHMTAEQFRVYSRMIGVNPEDGYARRINANTLGVLLSDLDIAANTFPTIHIGIPGDYKLLGATLARLTFYLVGRGALQQRIIQQALDMHPELRQQIGGERGDINLYVRRAIGISKNYINFTHIWQVDSKSNVLPEEMVKNMPPTLRKWLYLHKGNKYITGARAPLHYGQEKIDLLMEAFRANVGSQTMIANNTFETLCTRWYHDFMMCHPSTIRDDTGKENGIFAAFGVK